MLMRDYLETKRRALLMGANQWFLPQGLTAANVLAAYRFVGVGSEAEALKDLTGNGFDLVKTGSITWNAATGFSMPSTGRGSGNFKLNNSSLNGQNILCCVLRYADIEQNNRDYLMNALGSHGHARIFGTSTVWEITSPDAPAGYHLSRVQNYGGLGYTRDNNQIYRTGTKRASGVVGANFHEDNQLYYDGSKISATTSWQPANYEYEEVMYSTHWKVNNEGGAKTFGNSHPNKSDLNNVSHSSHKLLGASFYNVALNAAQHGEVAAAMLLW